MTDARWDANRLSEAIEEKNAKIAEAEAWLANETSRRVAAEAERDRLQAMLRSCEASHDDEIRACADAEHERDRLRTELELEKTSGIDHAIYEMVCEERDGLEAECDRLKAAMHPHTVAFVLENVRLARQVADLEAERNALIERFNRALSYRESQEGLPEGTIPRAAARSRDPQEGE